MAFGTGVPSGNTIQEVQQLIAQRRKELETSQKAVEAFVPKITQTAQQLLRQTPTGQARVQGAEVQNVAVKALVGKQIQEAGTSLQEYQKQFEGYLRTPSGIVQYSKEFGLKPTEEIRTVGMRGNVGQVPVKIYQTPYGRYEDVSGVQREIGLEQVERDIINLQQRPETLTQFSAKYGISPIAASSLIPKETITIEQIPQQKLAIDNLSQMKIQYPTVSYKDIREKYAPIIGIVPAGIEYGSRKLAEFIVPKAYEGISQPIGYAMRGSIAPERGLSSLPTIRGEFRMPEITMIPEQIAQRRIAEAEAGRKGIQMTAPAAAFGLGGAVPALAGGASAILFLSGLESYSKRGLERLKQQAQEYPKLAPLIYGAPALELVAGALGVRQTFMAKQLEALKSTTPEVSIGITRGDKLFQVAEQRIPVPGFAYKPRPFIAEPTLTGKDFISPRVITPMLAKLTPIQSGGFTFEGVARTGANIIDPFTGTPTKIISAPYGLFGKVSPGEAGRLVSQGIKVSPIAQTFYGKTTLEVGRPGKTEFFGGFPTGTTPSGIQKVVSFPIEKLRYYPISEQGQLIPTSVYRAVGQLPPKTYGFIFPETKSFSFFPGGTKAQVAFTVTPPSSTIRPPQDIFLLPSSPVLTFEKGIGQSVGRLGSGLLDVSKTIPLFKFSIPTKITQPIISIPKQIPSQVPKQIEITRTIDIPKMIEIPKAISISKTFQVPIPEQVQIPKIIDISIQVPVTPQVPRTVQINPPLNIQSPEGRTRLPPTFDFGSSLPPSKRVAFFRRKIIKKPASFQVAIRRRRKFQTVGIPLVKGEALSLGRRITKSEAAATFKLIPTLRKPGTMGLPQINEQALTPEFRPPKKGGDNLTFIQRRRFRISTPGEKRAIPGAAARARRIKWI